MVGEDHESKEQFLLLQDPQKLIIRQKLLECLQNEADSGVRHKVGDAVAEIARQYADDGMLIGEGLMGRQESVLMNAYRRRELARVTVSTVRR